MVFQKNLRKAVDRPDPAILLTGLRGVGDHLQVLFRELPPQDWDRLTPVAW